jgi:hypothetical protein
MDMTDTVKTSAKLAREFLGMIADGIGKVESGAVGDFTRSHASRLARQLPAKWRGSGGSNTLLRNLVIAGVVASTAVLIYSRTRGGKDAQRKKRR